MSPRNFRPSHQVRGQRRKLVWSTLDQNVTIAAGSWTNVNLLAPLSVAGSSLLGITIMRSIVTLNINTSIAIGDALAVGLIVCRVNEIGAAVAGSVDPAQLENDWLWLDKYYGSTGTSMDTLPGDMAIDTKAKRKMQELNQAYALSMRNSVGVAKTISFFSRVLVALP
jgi:hypothetical protein